MNMDYLTIISATAPISKQSHGLLVGQRLASCHVCQRAYARQPDASGCSLSPDTHPGMCNDRYFSAF